MNIPPHARGLCWTRQSVRHYDGTVVPTSDPYGRPLFWFAVRPLEEVEEGADRWAVENDCVSITPPRIDLTDAHLLERARRRDPL